MICRNEITVEVLGGRNRNWGASSPEVIKIVDGAQVLKKNSNVYRYSATLLESGYQRPRSGRRGV
jgi:hypothetical protein